MDIVKEQSRTIEIQSEIKQSAILRGDKELVDLCDFIISGAHRIINLELKRRKTMNSIECDFINEY